MIEELKRKLGEEVEKLQYELNVVLPNEIRKAVELGDLRENSEYKAALERQQFVQARLGQLHQRLFQLNQLANSEAPMDKVGLGSRVKVIDVEFAEEEEYMLVLPEMIDLDNDDDTGHISLASPLGRALSGRGVGEEVTLKLPMATRRLRIVELVTVHQEGAVE